MGGDEALSPLLGNLDLEPVWIVLLSGAATSTAPPLPPGMVKEVSQRSKESRSYQEEVKQGGHQEYPRSLPTWKTRNDIPQASRLI